MKKILHSASTRGSANFGWLNAKYSFSFANYFNPDRLQFGSLRVLNDDIVAPSMGFGKHPHQNMEIITIPQSGALKHRDSMGNEGVIGSGEIQVMSAGSGVEHSEVNNSTSEDLKLFQIWILPEIQNVTPRYDQKKIEHLITENTFSTIVKPHNKANKNELFIYQQAYISIGEFNKKTELTYTLKNQHHGIYVFIVSGTVFVEREKLTDRDAIGIWETDEVSFEIEDKSKILLFEVPMN